MKLPNKYSFVDVETTGTSPTGDRIIEIGIVQVIDGKVKKEYSKLVNPMGHLDPFITNMTGITPEMLDNAPTFYEIVDEVEEILSGSVFVAHNARFDYAFIKQEFARYNMRFSAKTLCTVKLTRQFYPGLKSYSLASLIEKYSLSYESRHRALDDAKVCFQVFQKIKNEFPEEKINDTFLSLLKKPSLPGRIPKMMIDALPETPGIYIFFGENNSCLYVGKSINIRSRVMQHFTNDYQSTTDMKIASQITDIEAIQTSGELSALLLESTTIKKYSPIYNKLLRSAYGLFGLKKVINKDGYFEMQETKISELEVSDLSDVIGIFRSHKEVKKFLTEIVKSHGLCGKYLGLEKTTGACFYTQLGWCSGACVGREKALTYNLRFDEAVSKTKIRPWNYVSPIVIKEKDKGIVVDKWCVLGIIDEHSDTISTSEYNFDYDTYKILNRFLTKPENQKKISTYKKYV